MPQFVQIARREWFFDFYAPRLYAMVIGQVPIMTALFLGVTDLHLLARLLSLGLFAVPTALYSLALMRVKDDAVLLAARIVDAVTDPLIGWANDRLPRRRLWIGLALPALGAGMVGLLVPPP